MPDYDKSTGTRGTMRIRDTGSVVEFWLKSSSESVFTYGKGWSYTSPNGNGSGEYDYPTGAEWKKIGQKTVTDSGKVTFTIEYSGASYFGGPTTLSVNISREEKPGAPSGLSETKIGHTTASFAWSNGGALNGGDFIEYQIQVASTPQSGSGNFTGTVEVTNTTKSKSYNTTALSPGVVYDWHVRQRTSWGWSDWSGIASFQSVAGAWVRDGGSWKRAVPYVKSSGTWKKAISYVKVSGSWKAADV